MTKRPTHYLPCLFCGTTAQVRSTDPFLTTTKSRNGRSYNFCKNHWRTLRQTATPHVIDTYRRHRLPERPRQTLAVVLRDLKHEMKYTKSY